MQTIITTEQIERIVESLSHDEVLRTFLTLTKTKDDTRLLLSQVADEQLCEWIKSEFENDEEDLDFFSLVANEALLRGLSAQVRRVDANKTEWNDEIRAYCCDGQFELAVGGIAVKEIEFRERGIYEGEQWTATTDDEYALGAAANRFLDIFKCEWPTHWLTPPAERSPREYACELMATLRATPPASWESGFNDLETEELAAMLKYSIDDQDTAFASAIARHAKKKKVETNALRSPNDARLVE